MKKQLTQESNKKEQDQEQEQEQKQESNKTKKTKTSEERKPTTKLDLLSCVINQNERIFYHLLEAPCLSQAQYNLNFGTLYHCWAAHQFISSEEIPSHHSDPNSDPNLFYNILANQHNAPSNIKKIDNMMLT